MPHIASAALAGTGYVVLDPVAAPLDPQEWRGLEYVGWRSGGITRFAPLASYAGEVECNGFWNHTPPRADRDGVWIPAQAEQAPTLTRLAREAGASVGRCRIGELQPNSYADAIYNLHLADNNRLNPEGAGRIVRAMIQLSDHPGSLLLLRADRYDPATEVRIPLRSGTRVILDSERVWHAIWNRGPEPLYDLVASWTCGPELDAYIAANDGPAGVPSVELDQRLVDEAQVELHRRLEERRRVLEDLVHAFGPHP